MNKTTKELIIAALLLIGAIALVATFMYFTAIPASELK